MIHSGKLADQCLVIILRSLMGGATSEWSGPPGHASMTLDSDSGHNDRRSDTSPQPHRFLFAICVEEVRTAPNSCRLPSCDTLLALQRHRQVAESAPIVASRRLLSCGRTGQCPPASRLLQAMLRGLSFRSSTPGHTSRCCPEKGKPASRFMSLRRDSAMQTRASLSGCMPT